MNPIKPSWDMIVNNWDMLNHFKPLMEKCLFFPIALIDIPATKDFGVFGTFYSEAAFNCRFKLEFVFQQDNIILFDLDRDIYSLQVVDDDCKILFCCQESLHSPEQLRWYLLRRIYTANEKFLEAVAIWREKFGEPTQTNLG